MSDNLPTVTVQCPNTKGHATLPHSPGTTIALLPGLDAGDTALYVGSTTGNATALPHLGAIPLCLVAFAANLSIALGLLVSCGLWSGEGRGHRQGAGGLGSWLPGLGAPRHPGCQAASLPCSPPPPLL